MPKDLTQTAVLTASDVEKEDAVDSEILKLSLLDFSTEPKSETTGSETVRIRIVLTPETVNVRVRVPNFPT